MERKQEGGSKFSSQWWHETWLKFSYSHAKTNARVCAESIMGPPPHHNLTVVVQEHHRHALHMAMVVMACMVGLVMILCTASLLIRFFTSRSWRYSRSRNTRDADAPILFDVNGDSNASDNDHEDLAVLHPIWYIRTVGLQQSLIDSITVFRYRKEDGIIDATDCSVCLGEFQHDQSLRLLPKCSHAFHIPCIDTWLTSHKSCPLCRAPVLHHHPNDQTDTNASVSGHHTQDQELHVDNSDEESSEVHARVHVDVSSTGKDLLLLLPNCSGLEEATQPLRLRRTVSVDSSSVVLLGDVALHLDGGKASVGKPGSETSTSSALNKVASSGLALQKKTMSIRRSFSHNSKFLFSTHSRTHSSTLPL